ncbi:hypothetical protein JTB14_006063 [Gonioctena quinquepunctata]|nr:hypothetical protein JTB14_006063 [Gonioctena quinquepunctata]
MLSDGGSESSLKKLQAVAAESLVNVQGKDVTQIHGEGWQIQCSESIVVVLLVEMGHPFREFTLNILE